MSTIAVGSFDTFTDVMKFGDKLRRLLKAKRYSQESVANQLGVSQGLVSGWCAGKYNPDLFQGKALADLLEVSLDFLADDAQEEPRTAAEVSPDEQTVIEIMRALDVPKNAAIQALAFIARERAGMDKDAPLTLLPPGSSGRIVGGVRDVTDREKSRDETPKRSGRREGDTIKSGTPDKP